MLNLVSIIIPTYNQANYLQVAIESLLAQTYGNWEAIVVNNYSTDNTKDVALSFQDPRIHVVDFQNNGVIAASRNHAFSLAKGEYTAFLDSDDFWEPTKLEICMKHLDDDVHIVCHAEYHFSTDPFYRRIVCYGPAHNLTYPNLLSRGNCLSTSAIVMSSKVFTRLGGFSVDPRINTAEDFDLWLRASAAFANIKVIDDVLGSYRIHPSSASASSTKNALATLRVVTNHTQSPHAHLSLLQRLQCYLFNARIRLFIFRKRNNLL
jgi:teichuronic acid biosynthesis glycosyltransferase TuaG